MVKVLVVDDLKDGADTLAALLTAVGHDASVAYDGCEGLRRCAALQPDIVVMDLDMPVIDGCAAARYIRSTRICTPSKLIALTGESPATAKSMALAAGFDVFLQKPANMAVLLELLRD